MICRICRPEIDKSVLLATSLNNPFRTDMPVLELKAQELKTEIDGKKEKRLFITVIEDDLREVEYMPNYCPECGRKL